MKDKHIGSSFDDFLQEEGLVAEAEATALKRVLAYQIKQEMKLEYTQYICNIWNLCAQHLFHHQLKF